MKQLLIISLFSIVATNVLYGQSHQNNFQNVAPPTPEVAAFAKSIDIPMNYGSGLPQIGIPFYTVKSGSISVPLSLSYNASGIRVEEQATRVGLGWNLSTGPTLTRSTRGLPDESDNGFMNSPTNKTIRYADSMNQLCNATRNPITFECEQSDYLVQVIDFGLTHNTLDLEPDVFTFSAFGYSGKFYWNQDSARFILSPYQHIKVIPGNGLTSFTLLLPDGTECYFGGNTADYHEKLEFAVSESVVNGLAQGTVTDGTGAYITSWAINTVTDPVGKQVTYHYYKNKVLEYGRGGETWNSHTLFGTLGHTATFYKQTYLKPVLSAISGDNTDIYFLSGAERQDVVSLIGGDAPACSLDTIMIKNKQGEEIKSFLLYYTYRISSDSTEISYLGDYTGIARKRLYLDSVIEKNITAGMAQPPYRFTYHSLALPNRLSNSQDFWGYYNGKNNGIYTIPRRPLTGLFDITGTELPMFPDATSSFRADRRIDSNYTRAGMLTAIQYPTGGTTRYVYEPNDVPRYYYKKKAGIEPPDMVEKLVQFMPMFPQDPPFPTYYSQEFTVTNPATKVKVNVVMPPPCNNESPGPDCRYSIHIKSLPDSSITHSIYSSIGTVHLQLPMGQYKVVGLFTPSGDSVPFFGATLTWGEHPDTNNLIVGGLRVKKIISADSVNGYISRSFVYREDSLAAVSSGALSGIPCHAVYVNYPTNLIVKIFNFSPSKIQSNSSIPLTSDGQLVHYTNVTEYYDTAGSSFKTNYKFYIDFNTAFYFDLYGKPRLTKEWQNNILRSKTTFEKIAPNTYRPLTHEYHTYYPDSMLQSTAGLYGRQLLPYEIATEWFVRYASENTVYTYPGGSPQASSAYTNYYYNNSFMVARTNVTNSKGTITENKTWYPYDYNNPSGFSISDLKSKYIIGVPIKQETTVDGKLVQGSVMKYNADGLPIEVYAYENSSLATPTTHDPDVALPTNYHLKTTVSYNSNKDVEQVTPTGSMPVAYVWIHQLDGYTPVQMQPVAEVQNAISTDLAYTSFELLYTLGNWNINSYTGMNSTGVTGNSHHSGSLNISKNSLNSSNTYIVTYWSKQSSTPFSISGTITGWPKQLKSINHGGTTWYCYEHKITGQTTITLSGTGDIDELRLYPVHAMMSTNHQQPGIGITAACNANNQIIYYEYDGLGRLKLVRDENKNILKRICYNYHNQQTDCSETYDLLEPPDPPNPCEGCTGYDKKCINDVCETGVPVLMSSVRTGQTTWECTYYYEFSDNTNTAAYYTFMVVENGPCF